jgi:hypothetical protein
MIGMRSWTPVALPGGYGGAYEDNDGWFDCRGTSGWLNPNCYGPSGVAKRAGETSMDMTQDALATLLEEKKSDEKPPNPDYDPYNKPKPKNGQVVPGGSKPIPWGTILPIGLGVLALSGALLFATRKKG